MIKETRKISEDGIRQLCIDYNFCNNCTNEQYMEVLAFGGQEMTTAKIYELAKLLEKYTVESCATDVTDYMWLIARRCHTDFSFTSRKSEGD